MTEKKELWMSCKEDPFSQVRDSHNSYFSLQKNDDLIATHRGRLKVYLEEK